MVVKVTKKVKYATALYHKINATWSRFYLESFMLFSKSAHLLDYAALLIVVVRAGQYLGILVVPRYWNQRIRVSS